MKLILTIVLGVILIELAPRVNPALVALLIVAIPVVFLVAFASGQGRGR